MIQLRSEFQNRLAALSNGLLIGFGLSMSLCQYPGVGLASFGASLVLTFVVKNHFPRDPLFYHQV